MSRLNDVNATSVYGVSVDSRSRPSDQPDNKYDVSLGRTLDRVKSIQLGSIQIPDCRYAFDSRSRLQYSEPMRMVPNSHLFIEQTVSYVNKLTLESSIVSSVVQILVPPTLNKVTGYDALTDTVTTQFDCGVDFGVKYYPAIGQSMAVVGAQFPQSLMSAVMAPFPSDTGPVLAATTVGATGEATYTYAPGYLDALTSTSGNYDQRHFLPGVATSYVYAPKPTLVELFVMLNKALEAQTQPGLNVSGTVTAASNAAPIVLVCAAPHGLHNFDQVVISGVAGNLAANGTFFVTVLSPASFSLNSSTGSGAYAGGGVFASVRQLLTLVQFGFDDANNTIVAEGPTRVLLDTRQETRTVSLRFVNPPPGAVSLSSYIGFGVSRLDPPARASVPDFFIRTVDIRRGNYSSDELVAMMNVRMNPLLFFDADPAARTLNYLLPGGGAPASVVLPRGRYTGVQCAAYLNFYMSQPLASIVVQFDDATGRFTFRQTFGVAFTLVFEGADNRLTAQRLGFEPVNYSGTSVYTSVNVAVYGVTSSQAYPSNTYYLSADSTQHHITFDTGDAVAFKSLAGTNTAGAQCVWQPQYECSDVAAGFAWSFVAGDVLVAQAPFSAPPIFSVSATSPVVVTTTGAHGLTSGDMVTVACAEGVVGANGLWVVLVTGATTFDLVGSAGVGVYVAGSGFLYSNTFGGVGTNTYKVVVQSSWDASGGIGLPLGSVPATLTLEPTVSILSGLDAGTVSEALGVPSATRPVYLQDAARSVFQLMFGHPDSRPSNFGFPSIAWPPYSAARQLFDPLAFSSYDPVSRSVPVSSSYTSPYCYNLLPPDYIIMVLCNPTGSKDAQTHTFGQTTRPFFAKLYITSPFLQISEQMVHSTFAGFQRINSVTVEFQNPDGTLVEFNGRPHSFSLLFTLYENSSETTCF
jgi:hypothetical protein